MTFYLFPDPGVHFVDGCSQRATQLGVFNPLGRQLIMSWILKSPDVGGGAVINWLNHCDEVFLQGKPGKFLSEMPEAGRDEQAGLQSG